MADGARELTPSEGPGGAASRAPLFRFDPGWPFVIAGLALIVSAVLIPAQRELHQLEQELEVHQAHEERAKAELLAYEQFLNDIKRGDERLLERLVRAQLNRMPKDERPLLLMPSANDTVPRWIESSVAVEIPEPEPYPDTLLSRLATGPRRLWVLATGAFLVFVGVMFAPSVTAHRGSRRRMTSVAPPLAEASVVASAAVATGAFGVEAAEAETLDSAVGAIATFEARDVHELQYPESAAADESAVADAIEDSPLPASSDDVVPMGDGTRMDDETPSRHAATEVTTAEVASSEAASSEVASSEVASSEYAPGDDASTAGAAEAHEPNGDASEEAPSDDHGEEIARAETVAMAEDPSEASVTEASVEQPYVDIETFRPPAIGSASVERPADPLSLFSGIADDRWIDTRAR